MVRIGVGLWLAFALAGCQGRPNIILVTIDALRPDHLGIYGYGKQTSPNTDAYFRAGRASRFEHAYSPAPCTHPAVQQVLSGAQEPRGKPRLAERLRQSGYLTAAVVSQHFFRNDKGPLPEYAAGFEHFDVQPHGQRDQHGMTRRSAGEVTQAALRWLDRPRHGPFFLWLHYFDPHDPYQPPARHHVFYGGTPPPGIDGDRRTRMRAGKRPGQWWFEAGHVFSAIEAEYVVSLYDAEIHYTDHELGRLLGYLDRHGLTRSSLVVLTADHGERLGEANTWDHCGSLHDWEIRVPLLVRWRGLPLRGVTAGAAVSTLDLVPTVLAAAGLRAAGGLDGMPLSAVTPGRRLLVAWHDEWVLRDGRHKLFVSREGAPQLFEPSRDPEERIDLSAAAPQVRAELWRDLQERVPAGHAWQVRTREIVEELRSIGYLE